MKKIYPGCYFLIAVFAINSCVSSLYPISDNGNNFLFREDFLGHWADKEMHTRVIVKKGEHKKYKVTLIDKKNEQHEGKTVSFFDTSYFSRFLIQLQNQYFFDCSLDLEQAQFDGKGEEAKSALLPLHFIYKIQDIDKDHLNIIGMNMDSVQKFNAKSGNNLMYDKLDKDRIILTLKTAELQKNILTNKEAAFVFCEPGMLTRQK